MRELLLRQTVRKLLVEQQEKAVNYKPSCAYEIKVNNALAQAGLRSPYTPGSTATFCFGTDSGADGEFQSPEGVVYNLEMKDGQSQAAVAMEDPLRDEVLSLIAKLEGYNTVSYIASIVNAQLSSGNLKGLNCDGKICPPNLALTPDDVSGLAQQIQSAQAPEIASLLAALQSPGVELPKVSLYYYFGRTGKAKSELKLPDVPPVGQPSLMDTGKWTAHYNAGNTYYIQVGGSGLYYMGSDPAELGVPPFDGSVTLGSRIRFKSSNSNSPIGGRGNNVYVTEAGQSISIFGRRFSITPTVDLQAGGSSPVDLDTPDGIEKLKQLLGYNAMSESIVRKLVREMLLREGRGEEFEIHLQDAINGLGLEGVRSEVVPAPSYDMNLSIGDTTAKVEIKLSEQDQLGKVPKCVFSKLNYIVGQGFDWELFPVGTPCKGMPSVIINPTHHELAPLSIAQVETVIPKMELLYKTAGIAPGTVVDCRSGWETQFPDIPIPIKGEDGTAYRQFSSHGTGLRIPAALVQKAFSKVDYLIIGNNAIETSGRIGYTGGDKLGLGVSPIVFNDSSIECRWGRKNPGRHDFTFETRAIDGVPGGNAFSSAQDLASLLSRKSPRSLGALDNSYNDSDLDAPGAYDTTATRTLVASYARRIINNILKEELTRTDKNEIERIAKKQAKKYFDKQIAKAIDDEVSKSYFGTRGKINKHVDDTITNRFKSASKDKDFDDAVIRVAKRVLKAMNDLHYKRSNLIDSMPVPKS